MNMIRLILLILFTNTFSIAQCQSTITAKTNHPRAGIENFYSYRPAKNLAVPTGIHVVALYLKNQGIQVKTVSAIKDGSNYTFSISIPDSTSMLILSITKPRPLNRFDNSVETTNIVDNNNGLGFIIPLYSKEGTRFSFEKIDKATLFYQFAPHMLKLKRIPKKQLITWYEDAYQKYPQLKNINPFDYHYYLDLLFKERGASVKPQLLEYAEKMQGMKQDEKKWLYAARTYSILGMEQEQSKVEDNIVKAYPTGTKARDNFWRNFYSSEKINTSSILTSMNEYISQFNDTTSTSRDNFYIQIISLYLKKKLWDSLPAYEKLITNKVYLANRYNNSALQLLGKSSDNNLRIAKMLSKMSMDYATDRIERLVAEGNNTSEDVRESYNSFADTYAQILYKLGQYDSAFYYQGAIYKQGDQLNEKVIERYALYSEQVKGLDYAKQVIEDQLLSGISTPVLLLQLQSIYKKRSIDDAELNAIKEKSSLVILKKNTEEIRKKFGTIKARNFTLKNILGQSISLSSLKGKVVIIDFWATWCVPCIASFPTLQATVTKYKTDKEVAFLFADILEHKTPAKMQENAARLMRDGNYTFNVILDVKDELVSKYFIESIPTQFIIDRKGNMDFMSEATDNLVLLIEAAKKL